MILKRLAFVCTLMVCLLFSSISFCKENYKPMKLKGKINNSLAVHMEINPSSVDPLILKDSLGTFLRYDGVKCRYSGYYYYDKYAKKIRIDGYLYSGGYIQLAEYDERSRINGNFYGFIKDGKIIKGVWRSSKEKEYPFYLYDSKLNPEELDFKVSIDKVGSYERIENNKVDMGYLTIYAEENCKFAFEISGYWVVNPTDEAPDANFGMVDGIASFTNASRTRAEYFNKEDNLKIYFNFSGKQVDITANDVIAGYCGMNVSLVGTFKKKAVQ